VSEREIPPAISAVMANHPYSLLFVTLSGAHLYGFPSPDSDYDLRGVHLLPLEEVVGLETGPETIEQTNHKSGIEVDLVTHEAAKFSRLLLKKNGYVLEQLFSPLVLHSTPEHEELKEIAHSCLTRHHAHHYLGFAQNQWRLVVQAPVPRVKPLLYTFRVLLTGIHLMRAGEIEANLLSLNGHFRLPYLPDLIARKLAGPEKGTLGSSDLTFYAAEVQRLRAELESARDTSTLPLEPTARPALHELLLRLRLA
jgi:uncharacterized protein